MRAEWYCAVGYVVGYRKEILPTDKKFDEALENDFRGLLGVLYSSSCKIRYLVVEVDPIVLPR